MTIKISITDDHPLVCKGIQSIVENMDGVQFIEAYPDAQQTIDGLQLQVPDVLLLDINLPDMSGIDLCKKLIKSHPEVKIIALSNFEEVGFVKRILSNGAHGYMLKNTDRVQLLQAFKAVLSGERYLQPEMERRILNQSLGTQRKSTLFVKLTRREKEVLEAIADELTTQEISEQLFISPKTVETHRMNLMSKLGAKNSVGIVKKALEMGLIG